MPHKNIEDRRKYAKDYLNTEEKEFNPKRLINNGLTERALNELDKCILVCANCYRLIHNSKY